MISHVEQVDLSSQYTASVPVNVKNQTDANITLSVMLWDDDKFVDLVFYPGWNPEIVKSVRPSADVKSIIVGW